MNVERLPRTTLGSPSKSDRAGMSLSLPLPLLMLPLLLGFIAGCAGDAEVSGNGEPNDVTEATSPEPEPVNVSMQELELSRLADRLQLSGRIEPWAEVTVSTELGGTVQEIGFEKGRTVQKGQVLARVGSDLFEAALAEAEGELMGADANFKKTSELFERQAVPRQDLVAATAQQRMSQARMLQAKLRVERSVITAPVSGIAVTREIDLGEVLNPGALITTIHQVSRLKAVVGIPEDDISYFRNKGEANLEVDAYPDRKFKGEIYFVGSAATGKNRTFPAEVAIDNRSGDLRPGMIARVSLVKQVFENAIVVPRDALLERDSGDVAFVIEDGRSVMRPVETGPSEGNRVVVLEGLARGEKLIVAGHRNLVQGQRVKAVSSNGADSKDETKK